MLPDAVFKWVYKASCTFMLNQILLNSYSIACVFLMKHRVGTTRKDERQTVKDLWPTFSYGRYAISSEKNPKKLPVFKPDQNPYVLLLDQIPAKKELAALYVKDHGFSANLGLSRKENQTPAKQNMWNLPTDSSYSTQLLLREKFIKIWRFCSCLSPLHLFPSCFILCLK